MWYCVETVFIDGKLFGSRCCFDEDDRSPVGKCYAAETEEPHNSRKEEFGGRIEIHLDWFESRELATDFRDGKITYVHTYESYYKKSINSTLRKFSQRKIVDVCEEKGILPHRGIYTDIPINYKPYWVR